MKKYLIMAIAGLCVIGLAACNEKEKTSDGAPEGTSATSESTGGESGAASSGSASNQPKGSSPSDGRYVDGP